MSSSTENRGSNWVVVVAGVIALGVVAKGCADISRYDEEAEVESATEVENSTELENSTKVVTSAEVPSSTTTAGLAEKLQADFNKTVQPCDGARKDVLAAVDTGDAAVAFAMAAKAEAICNETWQAVQRLKPPEGLSGEAAIKFERALETCAQTEFLKKSSLDKFQKALDSGMKPSRVAAFRETGSAMDAGILLCAAQFHEAVAAGRGGERAGGE